MRKVFLDPGHGGRDPGAMYNGLKEKYICYAVAVLVRAELIPRYVCKLSRSGDVFVPVDKRAEAANAWGADILVSIHCNADPDPDSVGMPEAKGSEIWVYPKSRRGRLLAECIRGALPIYFPDRKWRGVKDATFAVLRYSQMPAVLIEMAFIDTRESYKLADPGIQYAAARTIAAGIEEYFELVNL